MSFVDEKEVKRLFQKLPFCNTYIEKPHVKLLKNIDFLHKLPFYDELRKIFLKYAFKIHLKIMQEVKKLKY